MRYRLDRHAFDGSDVEAGQPLAQLWERYTLQLIHERLQTQADPGG